MKENRKTFTSKEAREVATKLGVKFKTSPFNLEQFRMGMDVELEHGTIYAETNVTSDDPKTTGKIALAHLHEFSDYYTRLEKLEEEAAKDNIK